MVFQNNVLAGASNVIDGLPDQFLVNQSIRFNSDDSAYLTRTQPTSTTTNKLFTISFWIKRQPGTNSIVYNGHLNNSYYSWLGFANDDTFFVQQYQTTNKFVQTTDRKFRDPSAFYHIVYIYDSANSIESDRTRLYVNGQRETLIQFTSNTLYPTSDLANYWIYTGVSNNIGLRASDNLRLDAYIAELAMFQDQGYEPDNFGETNSSGIWIPKTGIASLNFGDSGFYIKGENASDLGNDSGTANSGAGYDFTANGMETNDQRADTPTNNQITFNPLNNQKSGGSPSNGNLDYVGPGTRTIISLTANIPSTGKWAIAYKVAQVSTGSGWQIGISTASDKDFSDAVGSNEDLDLVRMQTTSSDLKINDAVNGSTIDPSLPVTTSDEFWVAVDMDSGKVFLGIYDASDSSMKFVANDAGLDGNPATGDNPTVTFTTAEMPRDDVVFSVGSKQTSQYIYLQRSTEVSGTTPTGYTYFENLKDLI
tara:strand:- start:749 stop:2188 length:1440 start_codon:yes stop_codon:yes gene_type:complete